MAVARMVEDMTLRELSEVVLETNGREDRIAELEHERIARETAARIYALLASGTTYYSPPHDFRPYPKRSGCVACAYPEDHPVHRQGTA